MNTFTDLPAPTNFSLNRGKCVTDRMVGLQQSLAGAQTLVFA